MKYALLAVTVACATTQYGRGQDVNPVDEFLRRCSEATKWESSAIIEGVTEERISGYIAPGSTTHTRVKFRKSTDGGRWALRSEYQTYDENGDINDIAAEVDNTVLSPREQFQMAAVNRHPNGKKPRVDLYQHTSEAVQRKKLLEESMDIDAPFYGYVNGNEQKSIFDLIMMAPDREIQKDDIIAGAPVTIVSGTTPYGHATIWIDKDRGYNALRWSISKANGDRFDDKPLFMLKYSSPESSLVSWEATLDHVSLRSVDGHWFPFTGQFIVKMAAADGRLQTCNININRTSVNLHPDFDAEGAFAIDVPNETLVSYVGQLSGLAYEWRDGKVVPAVNSDSIRSLDSTIVAVRHSDDIRPDANPGDASMPSAGLASRAVAQIVVFGYWTWGVLGISVVAVGALVARRLSRRVKLRSK